jgi:ribosomal protein S17E
MGDRRNYEFTTVFESNKTSVEEMINAWRQEQTVLPI